MWLVYTRKKKFERVMRKLGSYLSLRVTILLFVLLFLVFTISSYISEKRAEAQLQKNLKVIHDTKIMAGNYLLSNDKPITISNLTRQASEKVLSGNLNCEKADSTAEGCVVLNTNINNDFFSKNEEDEYQDVAIFNATGTRVFYKTTSKTLVLTPNTLSPRPSGNDKFTNSNGTFIGKSGTVPAGSLLIAFELTNDKTYLGSATFVVKQKSFGLYAQKSDFNISNYAIDASGDIRTLSQQDNKNPKANAAVIESCNKTRDQVFQYQKDGVKTFAIVSFVSPLNLCIVTETSNSQSSALGTNTYQTNYIALFITLLLSWLLVKMFGNKLAKSVKSIRERSEAVLLGQEVVEYKPTKIEELDELSKTFDFILHKFKNTKSSEEKDALLKDNILIKAKSTTTEALASRDKFKEAVEAAQDIIILLSTSGLVTYANGALHKTTGFDFSKVEGKYPYETWHKDSSKEDFKEAINKVLSNKESVIMNAEGKRVDGGMYESEIRLSPVEDPHTGVVSSILLFERDISDERQRDRVKNEFISVVSHELRTPMTVVRGYSTLLAEGKLGELNQKQKEYIDRINSEISRLLDLANDMLDLQKFDAGKADLQLAKMDLRDLLKDIKEEFEPLFAKKGLSLVYEDHTTSSISMIDKRYLYRAIVNIVQNALKFTEKGGVTIYAVNPDSDYVVAAIKDTGTGIPQEALPHLFTKFYQASNVLNRRQEGSGLGLSIVKKIVESHKGIVWVESLEGSGTTFYIALPLAK